jgi:hypothetical protein
MLGHDRSRRESTFAFTSSGRATRLGAMRYRAAFIAREDKADSRRLAASSASILRPFLSPSRSRVSAPGRDYVSGGISGDFHPRRAFLAFRRWVIAARP